MKPRLGCGVGVAASVVAATAARTLVVKVLASAFAVAVVGGAVASVALPPARQRVAPNPGVVRSPGVPLPGRAAPPPVVAAPTPGAAPPPAESERPPVAPEVTPPRAAAPVRPPAPPLSASASNAALAKPASTPLGEEVAALGRAHQALESGNPGEALRLLDGFFAQVREPHLKPEADALRIEALAAMGDKAGARSFLRGFREAHPDSPLLEHLEAVTGP